MKSSINLHAGIYCRTLCNIVLVILSKLFNLTDLNSEYSNRVSIMSLVCPILEVSFDSPQETLICTLYLLGSNFMRVNYLEYKEASRSTKTKEEIYNSKLPYL
jgi:hypothetical protein